MRHWSEEEKTTLKTRLTYDPNTGIIKWKEGYGPSKKVSEAGYVLDTGYRRIKVGIDGKKYTYRSHRVAWFLYHNEVPEFLDHINNDRLDNRICNLRVVDRRKNSLNSKPWGKSKFKGVHEYPYNKEKWIVNSPLIEGVKKFIGVFEDEIEAALAYDNWVEKELDPAYRPYVKTNKEMGLY
jgi:hypothetical protein